MRVTESGSRNLVVVTGIGGFLGHHLTKVFLEAGYAVRGTLRDLSRAPQISGAIAASGTDTGALDFRAADLLADDGWPEAMMGATALIHAASPFPSRLPADPQGLIAPARDGTRRVLKAAADAGVRRVVLTSSIAATNYGPGHAPFTEADWTDPDGPLTTAYYRSKTLAERAAWDFAQRHALALTTINPAFILGPLLGSAPGTSLDIVRRLLAGRYPAVPKFSVSVVDVRDVALLHRLALEADCAIGERFIAGGPVLSLSDIATILRKNLPDHAGRVPRLVLPNWLARLAAPFDANLRLIAGELGRDARVSSEKAERLLGWRPRPPEEAVLAAAQSLVAAGLIR
ncbi:epimerase [Xaviernesmea oryzae]|uniref:Epimerase n=1 Tax=Xaviernesmea oryzae TaxID=464029 RepID=A0A1Q9AXA9_9HYPH|nr:NAD-dependent epimerase/dehydratase family protein [Xaviernesmea oryzae]OLP60087.1 epimerase [Xaviernesmea oryzae]SEK37100.1 dihydroflavonol-4-reductase [Xaviernesmea oryzae]